MNLDVDTTAYLRTVAEQHDVSLSEVINEFLRAQIEQYRAKDMVLRRVEVIEQNLPRNVVNPPDDHPIFGGKQPHDVTVERRWDPREYADQYAGRN